MKTYANKEEVFTALKDILGFDKIIITGSTALKMWGMVEKSNPFDLDLVIYDIKPESWDKLTLLHKIQGSDQIIYPAGDTVRDEGALVSLEFASDCGPILVHIFCMERAKMTIMNRPFLHVEYKGNRYYLNHPMNIIEAKKTHGREKDFKQLYEMCSLLLAPLPEKEKPNVGGCVETLVK